MITKSTKKKSASRKKADNSDKSEAKGESSLPALDGKSVDLSGLTLIELSQAQRVRLRAPKAGVEEPARQAMEAALQDPGLLGIPKSLQDEIAEALVHLATAEELQPFDEWLQYYLDLVQNTRRFHMSKVGEVLRKITKRARLLREEAPNDAAPFDPLLDFYGNNRKS